MEKNLITKNGVRICGFKNSNIHSFTVSLFLRAGSLYESEKDSGFSHFFEHIVFRNINAKMGGKLYEELDLHGLSFNACTGIDNIEFSITGAPEHFKTAAKIITEVLSPIVISNAETEPEKRRIKAEIHEEGGTSLSEFSDSLVYAGTPLARSIAGKCGNIDRFGIKLLKERVPKMLSSENIAFYLAGCFDDGGIDYLKELIEKQTVSREKSQKAIAQMPALFGKRGALTAVKNAPATSVCLSFDIDTADFSVPEVFFLCDLLFAGETSPMYSEMSDRRGLIYSYDENIFHHGAFAILSVSYEIRADKLMHSLEAVLNMLAGVKDNIGDRIPFIKTSYTENVMFDLDDSARFTSDYGYFDHIMGIPVTTPQKRTEYFGNISKERINALASQVLQADNLTVAIKGNKKKINISAISELAKQILD